MPAGPQWRGPSFSRFLFLCLSGNWRLGASLTPGPAQGPSRSSVHISKCRLFSPTTGRIFNKPEKPLGRLPARVPPVSMLMTRSLGGSQLVHWLPHPKMWPEHQGASWHGANHILSLLGHSIVEGRLVWELLPPSLLDLRISK